MITNDTDGKLPAAACEHRVLVAQIMDPVDAIPCADCGAQVDLMGFARKFGRFYMVAAPADESEAAH